MTSTQSGGALPLAGPALLRVLAENWWLLLLRGIAAIAFGILAFAWPGLTLLTLTILWGAYALSDGIFALWAALSGRGSDMAPRWWLAVVGIASILSGLLAFLWPGITQALCTSAGRGCIRPESAAGAASRTASSSRHS